ncbi:MAG: DNA cytosine methyltransferase [Faecousia sp.]
MRVLVACEESQEVCNAFRERGHEAYSCDIIECSGGHPEWHIMQDVLPLLDGNCEFMSMDGQAHKINGKWDMIIAFPPCTYLSNAGACRLYPKKGQLNTERYQKGIEAKEFFLKLLNANCQRIAVENPVSSRVFEMPKHTQEIHPYLFDQDCEHPYTKKTRLWLRGLPMLVPTSPNAVPVSPYVPSGTGRKDHTKYGSAKRGEDAKNRAKTFPGIAKAMAEQWGGEVNDNRSV